jgi:hypothetical protein
VTVARGQNRSLVVFYSSRVFFARGQNRSLVAFYSSCVFLEKYSINMNIYIRMITHSYEYIYTHPISMSISERLNRLNLKIYEVDH